MRKEDKDRQRRNIRKMKTFRYHFLISSYMEKVRQTSINQICNILLIFSRQKIRSCYQRTVYFLVKFRDIFQRLLIVQSTSKNFIETQNLKFDRKIIQQIKKTIFPENVMQNTIRRFITMTIIIMTIFLRHFHRNRARESRFSYMI